MDSNIKQQSVLGVEYDAMVGAGMHFGRKKTVFHPNMKPFVYGIRDTIHIIDLTKTGEAIEAAVTMLGKACQEGKLVLFVGVTKQSESALIDLAKALNMPFVVDRWLGGTLTNFKVIQSRVKYLEGFEKQLAGGEFELLTKKERLLKERELKLLRQKYEGLRALTRMPDIVFVTSLKNSELPIHEAKLTRIKTIGIVNTDSDPLLLNLSIPANDNSRKSVEMVLNMIKDGVLAKFSKTSVEL